MNGVELLIPRLSSQFPRARSLLLAILIMAFKKHGRKYDVVVFGATGYTGQFAAEHIATHLPSNLRWAVAGRSESKLQTVVADCEKLNPDRNGTHYFDVTGEVPFVAKMISEYGKAAQASGALMFPEVGLESAPPDLMTWAMAKLIREKLSAKTGEVTVAIHTLDAAPSGGTLATVLTLLDNFSMQEVKASFRPYALSPIPNPTRAPSRDTILTKIFGARHVPELGTVTTSLAGTTDAAIVQRSWGLHTSLNEQESYGPNFSFKEYFRVRNLLHGVFVHIALFLGIIILGTPLRHVAHSQTRLLSVVFGSTAACTI
ncbi:putative trans-acting enoyl reductase like protein, partial [Verticillium longisporum]